MERRTHRVGEELLARTVQAVKDYTQLPLVEKEKSPLANPPGLAVIQVDGGRYQKRSDASTDADDPADESLEEEPLEEHKVRHWREDKVGLLMTMASEVHAQDPHPEIPAVFLDHKAVEKLAVEVGHVSIGAATKPTADVPTPAPDAVALVAAEPATDPVSALAAELAANAADYQPPEVLVRTMIATSYSVRWFEQLLRQAAWARGFAGAARKAFVADGAGANWTLRQTFFSDYTPILDFIHALSYVYLAAGVQRSKAKAWETYCRWIQWVWSGKVADMIAELVQQQSEIGLPAPGEAKTTPRSQLAKALTYLQNNQTRMRYDEYRRQGLPISSCHIESTIKRFNIRVKGTEKFWSTPGIEAMLTLKAAYLGETGEMDAFWEERYSAPTPKASYNLAQ